MPKNLVFGCGPLPTEGHHPTTGRARAPGAQLGAQHCPTGEAPAGLLAKGATAGQPTQGAPKHYYGSVCIGIRQPPGQLWCGARCPAGAPCEGVSNGCCHLGLNPHSTTGVRCNHLNPESWVTGHADRRAHPPPHPPPPPHCGCTNNPTIVCQYPIVARWR